MQLIRAEAEQAGIELLDVQFRRAGSRSVLTFTVDKTGGVTLDECAEVNRRLGDLLDRESEGDVDFLKGAYFLEVNSPGLDRPLKTSRDFERARGDRVRVAWKSPEGAGLVSIGRLTGVDERSVELETKTGDRLKILLESMTKASREIH
jgi:ribosome maturation factor RimP